MKIFNWFQKRRKEKKCLQGSSISTTPYPPQSKISDAEYRKWPPGLLAIGTLGANLLKEEDDKRHDPPSVSSQSANEASDFTIEEVIRLQKELCKLLNHSPKSINNGSRAGKDRFSNCNSSLDEDGELDGMEAGGEAADGHLSPESTVMILRKARDLISADDRSLVRRKSFAFLLKNMFVCRGGFPPSPSLRDPILVSRMEKLLRIILYKNIFPQTTDSTELQKYLENKANEEAPDKDISEELENRDCKWDKTDSDFIVLEM